MSIKAVSHDLKDTVERKRIREIPASKQTGIKKKLKKAKTKRLHKGIEQLSDYRLIFAGNNDVCAQMKEQAANAFVLVRQPVTRLSGSVATVVPFKVRIFRKGHELFNSNCTITLEHQHNNSLIQEYISPITQKFGEISKPEAGVGASKEFNEYIKLLELIDFKADAAKQNSYSKTGIITTGAVASSALILTAFFSPSTSLFNFLALVLGGFGGWSLGGKAGRAYHSVGNLKNALCCIREAFPLLSKYDIFIKSEWNPNDLETIQKTLADNPNVFILVEKLVKSKTKATNNEFFEVFIYKNGKETKNSRTRIYLKGIKSLQNILKDKKSRDEAGRILKNILNQTKEHKKLLKTVDARAIHAARDKYEKRGRWLGTLMGGILAGVNFFVLTNEITYVIAAISGLVVGGERGQKIGSKFYELGGLSGIKQSCEDGCLECCKVTGQLIKNCGQGIKNCCGALSKNIKKCCSACINAPGKCLKATAQGCYKGVSACCSGIGSAVSFLCKGIGSCFKGIYNCGKAIINKCRSGCETVQCTTTACKTCTCCPCCCCDSCSTQVYDHNDATSSQHEKSDKVSSEKTKTRTPSHPTIVVHSRRASAITSGSSNASHARRTSTMMPSNKQNNSRRASMVSDAVITLPGATSQSPVNQSPVNKDVVLTIHPPKHVASNLVVTQSFDKPLSSVTDLPAGNGNLVMLSAQGQKLQSSSNSGHQSQGSGLGLGLSAADFTADKVKGVKLITINSDAAKKYATESATVAQKPKTSNKANTVSTGKVSASNIVSTAGTANAKRKANAKAKQKGITRTTKPVASVNTDKAADKKLASIKVDSLGFNGSSSSESAVSSGNGSSTGNSAASTPNNRSRALKN